jgi:hypothetical protein
MSNEERQALLDEANALGLEFPSNIPSAKLEAMIAESQGPAVKEEEEDAPAEEATPAPKVTPKNARHARRLQIKNAKDAAMKTRVVTITNKDKRENEVMTTVHLSCENQHFGVSKIVPLDIAVEVEQCLIDIAEGTMMTLHKDEIKNGQRTGNKVAVPTKKFIVSYSDQKPE